MGYHAFSCAEDEKSGVVIIAGKEIIFKNDSFYNVLLSKRMSKIFKRFNVLKRKQVLELTTLINKHSYLIGTTVPCSFLVKQPAKFL